MTSNKLIAIILCVIMVGCTPPKKDKSGKKSRVPDQFKGIFAIDKTPKYQIIKKDRLSKKRAEYSSTIATHVLSRWRRPKTNIKISCTASLEQNKAGAIKSFEVICNPKNPAAKKSIIATIKRSDPLPRPRVKKLFDETMSVRFE